MTQTKRGLTETPYGFEVESSLPPPQAEELVRRLLKEEGFGVLTEIDVRATLRDKLGVDFRPYRILGACNPKLAHRAPEAEPGIGLMLPCTVVVEESGPATTLIRFKDPEAVLGIVSKPELTAVAAEARGRLMRVAAGLNYA
ncbi:MAG: DUF302 domain-containing protein [Candidatus Dormibacteraceae bacterium]